ncbi:chitinase 1 [Podospora australis]|uniref:chitinase n=1 Tax=Podospora australis TaxID=1536484 RepID=A0AAN6X414_9PEZI|nr:chitinase 1 [Podospora australis]
MYCRWHTAVLPNRTLTKGITHVITAFANSNLFTTDPPGEYVPFMNLTAIRAMFDPYTRVCMAVGGWGETEGFGKGAATEESRKLFAKNVALTVKRLGYDCVDIDWEYPGGNGADYKTNPNSNKTSEIETYPLLLAEIKKAIKCKELSIAVPGLQRDMMGYTKETVQQINKAVDFVNVMTYDLMNRRDSVTTHHTSVAGSLTSIKTYLALGFPAKKLNLGFAFYAKWFLTAEGKTCDTPTGCPTEVLEAEDGTDTGKSGAVTFEASNFAPVPVDLTESPGETCGGGTWYKCPGTLCCGQYGFCGNTTAHCGLGCQSGYGTCTGPSTTDSLKRALASSRYDKTNGADWFWDNTTSMFWSFDTPTGIAEKFEQIVDPENLGGVFAWSLGEDSFDWGRLKTMQKAVSILHGVPQNKH